MKTVQDILRLSAQYLRDRGVERARREAEDLLCDALHLDRVMLYMEYDRPLTEPELTVCRENLKRRGQGEPLPYIRGKIDFFGCLFELSREVLIPRQETELLVDKIAQTLKNSDLQNAVLWDVCCGSGCIGISLKKQFPALNVILSDLSSGALEIARRNAKHNEVEVEIRQGDLLQPFQGERANFFVCNPPYVSEGEYSALSREVGHFEPKQALVGGARGTEFYERLAAELAEYLAPKGKGWFEIGALQGPALLGLFSAPPWKSASVEKDFAQHDRFFSLEIE